MKHYPNTKKIDHATLTGIGMMATTLLVLGLGMVLIWFSVLRENEEFWTNAGGYPIWLRDLVLWTFWPLVLGSVTVLFGLSAICVAKIGGGLRFFVIVSMLILLSWGLVTTVACIALEDNVDVVISGVTIHNP